MEYPESVIRIYEEYILAPFHEKEAVISKLVKGSTHYKILKCIDTICKPNPTKEDQQYLDEIITEYESNTSDKKKENSNGGKEMLAIWIKHKIGKYQASTSNEEKLSIMKELLKRAIDIDLSEFKKPLNANSGNNDSSILTHISESDYSEEVIRRKIEEAGQNILSPVIRLVGWMHKV